MFTAHVNWSSSLFHTQFVNRLPIELMLLTREIIIHAQTVFILY